MNTKIKVLQVVDKLGVSGSTVDGVARMLEWWLPLMAAESIDSEVLVLGCSGKVTEELRSTGQRIHVLERSVLDPRALIEFVHAVRRFKPDILHVHNWRSTSFALLLKRRLSIPVIVHEHIMSPRVPLIQQAADLFFNNRVDRVLAVSRSVARQSIRQRRFSEERVETIENGVPLNPNVDFSRVECRELRGELGIGSDTQVIGFVGRLDEQKGPEYLIRAFAQLSAQLDDAVLIMVGDGPLAGKLKKLCEDLGISSRVRFAGYRRDVDFLRTVFSVQAMPSLAEGLPLSAIEAMATGVPLVASQIPGIDELLSNGINAILVPPADSEALAKALAWILREQGQRSLLAASAQVTARHFDIKLNVAKIANVYRQLADLSVRGSVA